MKLHRKNDSGMALLLAMIVIVVMLGALMIATQLSSTARHNTENTIEFARLEEACKAGVDVAVEQLWNQYVIGNGNTTGNLASYRVFIDDIVDPNASASLLSAAEPLRIDENTFIERLNVSRVDDLSGIILTLDVIASMGDEDLLPQDRHRQRVEQTLRVSGQPFAGFEYAVLANYINCILCHAGFYSLPEQYNDDPDLHGSFDRVKVATLEALLYRPSTADSVVAGTVYTRGQVYDEGYRPRTPAQIENSDFKHFKFSTEDGKIIQDASGLMTKDKLKQAGVDAQGRPTQFASLYTNYPRDDNMMTDGPLPLEFPAPFPDNDEDRYIDDEEFEEIAGLLSGSVTGGIAYGVPAGGSYTTQGLPAASNGAMASLSASGRYDGNLILVGTEANPIVLDGEIAVNGDLIMQGKVKGRGQIFVRGNSYLTGDVTYADAPGEFGRAADGTENAMALVTGGSVLMGDYVTIRGKNHTQDMQKYPNSAYSIRSRQANVYANVTINNKTERIDYGYFSPGVIDANEIAPTMVDGSGNVVPRQGQQFSFTQSELQLFNNLELEKALADPEYKPRFYGLRDTQPNNIYIYTKISEEHAVHYTETTNGVMLLTDRLIQLGIDVDSVLDRAAFHYMNPSDHWISEETLRRIWWNDEMQRTRVNDLVGSSWKFDGLLYSNNAIFAITRSYSRHRSNTNGRMEIRGAIICPDLGVLAAGRDVRGEESFTLLYDPRVREFWSPTNTARVFFQRQVYRTLPLPEEG